MQWRKLGKDWVKLIFEGCTKKNPSVMVVARIIKDAKGRILEAYDKYVGTKTNDEVEDIALWRSFKRIKDHEFNNVLTKGDSNHCE